MENEADCDDDPEGETDGKGDADDDTDGDTLIKAEWEALVEIE